MPIVQGKIGKIKAKDIRLPVNGFTINVPLVGLDLYKPELISEDPVVCTDATIEYGIQCAKRVLDSMGNLPHAQEASDLLTMAYAIMHFADKK